MNSEKVKEIKKALQETIGYCARELEKDLFQKSLTLINELESENERLIKKNNHLLDRNRDLIRVCDTCKISLKQFAERLIEKVVDKTERYVNQVVMANDIDETLKEFIGE